MRKTKKIYGGKLRRWFANNIGNYFCPYPLVRDSKGKCTRKSSRTKKVGENIFNNVGKIITNPYNTKPYKFSPTISISETNSKSKSKMSRKNSRRYL